MRVIPVPCLQDNYAYLVAAEGQSEAVVIDPSEAAPVKEALAREGLHLAAILNTHHHWDHVGGNPELAQAHPGIPVYAHQRSLDERAIRGQTVGVEHESQFNIAGLSFRVLSVPGHTLDAVAYCVGGAVFTGDTMFVAGCGRLFEGTPEMMYESLCKKLAALPGETRVYCGHEYTASNLRFAAAAEPENEAVKKKIEAVAEKRSRGEPTVPSTIAEELATNPFLRVDEPSLRHHFPGVNGGEVLGKVRAAKDSFR